MRRAARYLVLSASNRLIHCADGPDGWKNTGIGGTTFGGAEFATPLEDVARRLDDMTGAPMSTRPKYDLIVELCAGTAALSWALGGMKFPVSRMGSKAGYSWSILSALGLSVGDMPRRFLWVEPDEELARTLALLTTPGGAAAVAAVIRSWIPCPNGHDEGGAWCLECATWTNGEPLAAGPSEDLIERKRDGTIRRWASGPSTGKQDARRLWERLRKERPGESPEREGSFVWMTAANRLIPGHREPDGRWVNSARNTGERGGVSFGGEEFATDTETTARNLDNLAPLPATVVCGRAEDIEPRAVAAWLGELMWIDRSGGFNLYGIGTGENRRPRRAGMLRDRLDNLAPLPATVICGRAEDMDPERVGALLMRQNWTAGGANDGQGGFSGYSRPGRESFPGCDVVAPACDNLAPLPATVVCGRAEDVPTPPDCSRVLCYIDPPYERTTGYAHLFPRAAVVEVARRWAAAGAHVVISEAEPIPELVADGWHFTDIADARVGQRRTFSKQQREVLTSNRPLVDRAAWPARDALPGQGSLFG